MFSHPSSPLFPFSADSGLISSLFCQVQFTKVIKKPHNHPYVFWLKFLHGNILCKVGSMLLELSVQIPSLISKQEAIFFQAWLRERNFLINHAYNNSVFKRRIDFIWILTGQWRMMQGKKYRREVSGWCDPLAFIIWISKEFIYMKTENPNCIVHNWILPRWFRSNSESCFRVRILNVS